MADQNAIAPPKPRVRVDDPVLLDVEPETPKEGKQSSVKGDASTSVKIISNPNNTSEGYITQYADMIGINEDICDKVRPYKREKVNTEADKGKGPAKEYCMKDITKEHDAGKKASSKHGDRIKGGRKARDWNGSISLKLLRSKMADSKILRSFSDQKLWPRWTGEVEFIVQMQRLTEAKTLSKKKETVNLILD
ncbi:hypothetical protein L6452_13840 [Arctium lappa]|uniref:Uncharacterized protein n=1 Tax=Arctium lappa TaxID=4217 RepID=A0ACB9CJB7_ARCLA|nr:hypothetical protein L6452_13840 [Arctium lappa]